MAANVLFVIIPAHWELIRAKEAGREPDPAPGLEAKRRSVHNNYLTLPVLFTMLAGHFPVVYGAERAWLVLVVMMALGALARLFYNLRHRGRTHWWMPAVGVVALIALALALRPPDDKAEATPPDAASLARGEAVFAAAGCGACHTLAAANATGDVGPNLDAAAPSRALVVERVTNGQGGDAVLRGAALRDRDRRRRRVRQLCNRLSLARVPDCDSTRAAGAVSGAGEVAQRVLEDGERDRDVVQLDGLGR